MWGQHLALDLRACDRRKVTDGAVLREWVRDLVERIGMRPHGDALVEHFASHDPEVGGYLRMVTSYWDMAAALVNHGAIDADLFNETAGEHIFVFAKIEPILADLRERFQSADIFRNLEKVISDDPKGAEKLARTKEMIKTIGEQMAAAEGAKAGAAA